MTLTDILTIAVALILGVGGIYWQREEVKEFREQNRLIREERQREVGPVTATSSPRLRLYWPMIATGVFMLLTWVAVGINVYDRHSHTTAAVATFDPAYIGKAPPKHVWRNEIVVLDGFFYDDCEFYNVTFKYNGTTAIQFDNNKVHGFSLASDNAAIGSWGIFLKSVGATPGVHLNLAPGANTDIPHGEIR